MRVGSGGDGLPSGGRRWVAVWRQEMGCRLEAGEGHLCRRLLGGGRFVPGQQQQLLGASGATVQLGLEDS